MHGSHPDVPVPFPAQLLGWRKHHGPWIVHSTLPSPPAGKQPHPESAARTMLSDPEQRAHPTFRRLHDPLSLLLQQLILLQQFMWDGGLGEVLQAVSSRGNRGSKVPLRP